MKEEKKLMKLNLKNENQKLENIQISGIQLYFFNFVHFLLQTQSENYFMEYLLIIYQFIQLMAFPMDLVFSSGWKTSWFKTLAHFFHYFQLLFIFIDFNHFYIISFFTTFLYILIFIILLVISMHRLEKYSTIPDIVLLSIYLLIQLNTIFHIPIFKILFNVFSCEKNNILFNENIVCKGKIHIMMIVISCILIIFYFPILILFKKIYFEFGVIRNKLKTAFTSSTEVLLVLVNFILVIVYQFIRNEIALSIITFILSLSLFIDYYGKQPFANGNLNKTYLTLYLLFLWTTFICFIGLILKNSKFEGAIFLLLIGYPFIILLIITKK